MQKKVSFHLFSKRVEREMKQRYPHCVVELQEVIKNNGKKLIGIAIRQPGCNISPIHYLNSYYEAYQLGDSYENVFQQLIESNEEHSGNEQFDMEYLQDYQNVKERIYFKLINADENEDFLQEIPYRQYQDLAIVYSVLLSMEEKGNASMNITNQLLELWQEDENMLYQLAKENTPRLLKGQIMPLSEVVQEMIDGTKGNQTSNGEGICDIRGGDTSETMYVASNVQRTHGAAVILYEGVLDAFAEQIGGDFYILPSSVHETLLVPVRAGVGKEELTAMLQEVNESEVQPDEVLSNHVYCYYQDTGSVRLL